MWQYKCRYFLPDRPCPVRKENQQNDCFRCPSFCPVKEKILLIKLGAPGDVLRTTFLLKPLKEKYPFGKIYWLVERSAKEILQLNSFIDKILVWPDDAWLFLLTEKFDLTINLDLSEEALKLMGLVQTKRIQGFYQDKNNRLLGTNASANYWIKISLNDRYKKANRKTYQQVMTEILGLPDSASQKRPVIELPESSLEFAKKISRKWKLAGHKIVGINPGAGKRWPLKQWTFAGNVSLIKSLLKEPKIKVLLFGGENEQELLKSLSKKVNNLRVINTGFNPLKDFFALINLVDVLVTTDSLALHAGLSLKKKIVAIFGPTSFSEIEMYNSGRKIITPLKCRVCYRSFCDKHPNCMEAIKPEIVIQAVKDLLAK